MFRVYVQPLGTGHVVGTEKGVYGGSLQLDLKPVEPKNVGRANETSTEDQALSEALSQIKKLEDKGYKYFPEWETGEIGHLRIIDKLTVSEGTDPNGRFLPMLAQKNTDKIHFPGYLQKKFDGMRCIVSKEGGELCARSRNGKLLENLDHILSDVSLLMKDGEELDGELYIDGRSLQSIVSLTKRYQPDTELLTLRVYDMVDPYKPFKQRLKRLKKLALSSGPSIRLAHSIKVKDWEKVNYLFSLWRKKGYEGAMWRDPDEVYEPGKRSYSLIKIKAFLEEEFEIIGAEEATGRDAGSVIWVCKTKEGVIFNVRPMGTREERREYWENYEDYVGSMLTVRFQDWTPDGKPFHARGIVIRDYD